MTIYYTGDKNPFPGIARPYAEAWVGNIERDTTPAQPITPEQQREIDKFKERFWEAQSWATAGHEPTPRASEPVKIPSMDLSHLLRKKD